MKKNIKLVVLLAYLLFLVISFATGFNPGKEIAYNFSSFLLHMVKIMPFIFILLGLFEVWVKRETVEKYFGEKSGIKGYLGAIFLASTTVGGLYVAFPVAHSLYGKGAKLSIIFTYLGAAAVCRIPMTVFEASFLGVKFTLIRLLVSLPLVIISSVLLGNYLGKRDFKIAAGK